VNLAVRVRLAVGRAVRVDFEVLDEHGNHRVVRLAHVDELDEPVVEEIAPRDATRSRTTALIERLPGAKYQSLRQSLPLTKVLGCQR